MRCMSDELVTKEATGAVEKKLDLLTKRLYEMFVLGITILIISSISLVYSVLNFMKV